MQQSLINITGRTDITYLVGNESLLSSMPMVHTLEPFNDKVIIFLNNVSKRLLTDKEAKAYPDVVTFAFWIRKASVENLRIRFLDRDETIFRIGRGLAFHIAPSNVPVNYAYSLVTGLLTGNANVVRIPSKDFAQVTIINKAIVYALKEMPEMQSYVCLVRYGHNQEINTEISTKADIRIVWGGDATIFELRKSPMKPRATEITFADRYSVCMIDSDSYIKEENKALIANNFYNDTFLTDQNACTSPRLVIWTGSKIEEAKEFFWNELHNVVKTKYIFQDIQGVNKLTSAYIVAACMDGVVKEKSIDNLIVRVLVQSLDDNLMEFRDNSGYFYEYHCKDITEVLSFCDDTRCQTLSYLGDTEIIKQLLKKGIKGIDRVVPIGKTMDFELYWDGYNLFESLTRIINIM